MLLLKKKHNEVITIANDKLCEFIVETKTLNVLPLVQ